MVEINERDLEIISFIKNYKCVTSQMIAELYFSEANNNVMLSNRRLNKIAQVKKLNRYRENVLSPNIWYFGKRPVNLKHTLIIAELYTHLKTHYDCIRIEREYMIKYGNGKSLKADLMAVININKKPIPFLFEIDLKSPYNYKWDEYITQGYYKTKFPTPPTIISISRFNHVKSNIYVKLIKQDQINTLKLD